MVCGYEYGPVDDKEVGVCRRQPLTVVIDGIRHRQPEHPVRSSVKRAESFQLLLQEVEILVVLILLVVTPYI